MKNRCRAAHPPNKISSAETHCRARGDGRAAVLAGGGRAAADFGAERRLGVGGTAPGASTSPSSSLGRRSRGGGGVAEAVDDEVVAATDGGVVWGFSGGRL
jgi:hypothetical protein